MPSASDIEAVSVETGWASVRASTISDWLAQASSESAHSLLSAVGFLQSGAETRERRLQQLDGALLGTRERRHERDAREVERRGERQHLVVGNRDDESLADDDERVLVRCVELDRELRRRRSRGRPPWRRGCPRRCGT